LSIPVIGIRFTGVSSAIMGRNTVVDLGHSQSFATE
jgi:hypothetical protein